jgi:MFS transporter, PPP family, 3-phenylpropionic acid transporter
MKSIAAEPRIKAFYFFFFAAAAAFMPYLALYYEQRGLAGRSIGILTAIPPIVTLFAASFWSGIADANQRHRRVLLLAVGGTIASAAGIFFSQSFFFTLMAVVVFAMFKAPIIPLIDDAAMKALRGKEHKYGRLRIWGAVGWGISAPIIGLLVRRGGQAWPFYGYVILLCLGEVSILGMPVKSTTPGREYKKSLARMMRNPKWMMFLLIVFVAGIGSGTMGNYLFLYMNHMQTGPVLMGLALTAATLSELLVFGFSDRILKRWGVRKMLIVSLLAILVRLLAYSFASTAWMILIIQLLHGLTFSMLWVAGVAYSNRSAPQGLETTAQGMFSGVVMGLSSSVGAFVGGWLYELAGPQMMFRWTAIGILILMAGIGATWFINKRIKRIKMPSR